MGDLLVHDWIEQNGGAEKVLDNLVAVFPDADVLTLWNDAPGRYPAGKVIESPLARTFLRGRKALSVPIQAMAWRGAMLGRSDIDRVVVSSHLFAHHVGKSILNSSVPKYVYVHTPARYMWEPSLDARGNHLLVRAASSVLRPLDKHRAKEATSLAANSHYVRERILRCWDMDATVIHPPVDTRRIRSESDWRAKLTGSEAEQFRLIPQGFILGASRFVPYKRLDLVIKAGEQVNRPVVLAGAGPDFARLQHMADEASVPVMFVHKPSDAMLYALYQQTAAYVFPAVEDFGIMPVEAMSAGAPVLCNSMGGARESVGLTEEGEHADFDDPDDVVTKLQRILQEEERVDPMLMEKVFGPRSFQYRTREWVAGRA